MRRVAVLAFVVAGSLILAVWLRPAPETFDERFERTQEQLEAMADNIETELERSNASARTPAARDAR